MKKYLEKLVVFKMGLRWSAFLVRWRCFRMVRWSTNFFAWLNLKLNRPKSTKNASELAETWVGLMPPDGRKFFKIEEVKGDTAFVQIHLECPLRDTGNVEGCRHLMNYDRRLMKKVGGNLVVLSSQSNSGKSFCRLAIRGAELPTDDLIPAHQIQKR